MTRALAVVTAVVGAIVIWMVVRSQGGETPGAALVIAFWAGVAALAVGVGVLLFLDDVLIEIDPDGKKLTIHHVNNWSASMSEVPFDKVVSLNVCNIGIGRKILAYHLTMELRSGKQIPTNHWSFNQVVVIDMADRLSRAIGCQRQRDRVHSLVDIRRLSLATLGAILIYVLWYLMVVGTVSLGMWYGLAPAMVITVSFFILFHTLRRWL